MTRTLLCLGFGYTAQHYVRRFGGRFERVAGTARGPAPPEHNGVIIHGFDGTATDPALQAAAAAADAVLVSIPPAAHGDPALPLLAGALAAGSKARQIVYLSTVGVYGDHAGGWVDETTPATPRSARSRLRLDAERAWQGLRGPLCRVAILRLAGIYGPGRNALVNLRRGTAQRIVKPGQVFNRIEVGDIGHVIDAVFARGADGVVNVVDDEPSPSADPVLFASRLLGVAPPPEQPYEAVAPTMTAMARSFYAENKRVRSVVLRRELGVALAAPSYREGLTALFAAGEGRDGPSPAGV